MIPPATSSCPAWNNSPLPNETISGSETKVSISAPSGCVPGKLPWHSSSRQTHRQLGSASFQACVYLNGCDQLKKHPKYEIRGAKTCSQVQSSRRVLSRTALGFQQGKPGLNKIRQVCLFGCFCTAVRSESRLFEFESHVRHCSCVYLAHPAFLLLSELPGKVSNLC